MSNISYDCLIIGAGISGINAAYYLQKHCPWATYRILENRSNLGGTWDLFKYPGIRSDSDMFTFGFSWKVWSSPGAIASGAEILAYLKEAAVENDILKHVDFDTDVKSAEWRSADNQWHLVATDGKLYKCNFLIGCTGYYSYDNPHLPYISGQENFKGLMVHPQMWQPEHSKEIVGKKVAIIGSGATAITLLPSISECVDHVTMVQRTPAYIAVRPREDPLLKTFGKIFPFDLATKLTRWITSVLIVLALKLCVHFPSISKRFVKWTMYRHLSGSMSLKEFEKHFNPPYTPYQQRLCLAPQGDFFKSIKSGKASIATGHIDHLTERGIRMKDGSQVEADFIIMATGLTMSHNFPFSTMQTTIDGQQYKPNQHLIYKGCMLENIPNMAFIMGYCWCIMDIESRHSFFIHHPFTEFHEQQSSDQGDPERRQKCHWRKNSILQGFRCGIRPES